MPYLNGRPVTIDELLPLALTNYGTFTSMRVESGGGVRGFSLHLDRLDADSRSVFDVGVDVDQIRQWIRQAIATGSGPRSLRVTLYDPALGIGSLGAAAIPHALVTIASGATMPRPALSVASTAFTRDAAATKHIGLWSQMHRRRQALAHGYGDALFLEPDGRISEGVTWNLGLVDRSGTVVWPEAPVLPGTTMRLLRAAYPHWCARPVRLGDLGEMVAAFATNVSIGVRAISRIDDYEFPSEHATLNALRRAYMSIPCEVV